MSAEKKNEYLLLFRGSDWDKGLSPEELQQTLGKFMGWFERLNREGTLKAGQPLERLGKIVSGKNGGTVADGPFAESKEAIGGYFLLQIDTQEEAIAIARQCPLLNYGCTVEVRPIAEQCPTLTRVNEQLAQAST